MTQPFPYLALVDTLDTIVLSSGTSTPGDYTLNRRFWSPAIAARRTSPLGGRGAYSEVVEEIEINIAGATASAVMASLERLNRMLDRAERWAAGELAAGGAVTLRYSPQGSTVSLSATALTSIVLGRAPGDTSRAPVDLPPTWTEVGMTRAALKVRLRLWRRGRWLAPTPTATYSSTSVGNGNVMIVSGVPDHQTMSPVESLLLASFTPAAAPTLPAGFLCVGCHTADVVGNYSMATATSAGYTTVADAANRPLDGANVLRYTATGTPPTGSGLLTIPESAHTSPVAVLLNARSPFVGRSFTVRVRLIGYGVITETVPITIVGAASNHPQWYRLGIVRPPFFFNRLQLMTGVDSIAGGPEIDFDSIALVALHDPTSRVIQYSPVSSTGLTGGSYSLSIYPRAATGLTPELYGEGTSGGRSYTRYDDAIDLEMIGTTYRGMWLATQNQYWRAVDGATAVLNARLDVRRRTAWLGPQ